MNMIQNKLGAIALSGMLFMNTNISPSNSIYKKVSPSIVTVQSTTLKRDVFSPRKFIKVPNGSGTGFFIDNKHIVTNYHVIRNADVVIIKDRNDFNEAVIDSVDTLHDIALLHLNNSEIDSVKGESLKLCKKEAVIGQEVFAIGNPFGLDKSFTAGIISGLERTLEGDGEGNNQKGLLHMIQVDAAINPGNSGGALVDAQDGCVLGMNTAIISSGTGIGFATPSKYIQEIIDADGLDGDNLGLGIYLGVELLPDNIAAEIGLHGAVIVDTIDGMPASDAGLLGTKRSGDGYPFFGDIIIGINSGNTGDWIDIRSSIDLFRVLDMFKKGDTINFKVLRPEGVIELCVTV